MFTCRALGRSHRACTRAASTEAAGQPLRVPLSSRLISPRAKRALQVIQLERGVRKLGRFPLWDTRALGAAASRKQHAGKLRRPGPGNPKPDFTQPPLVSNDFIKYATRTRGIQDLYFSAPSAKVITRRNQEHAKKPKAKRVPKPPPPAEFVKNLLGGD